MKSILYIGNILSQHGSNLTSIETLGPLFDRNGIHVIYASAKKNKVVRLLDMIATTIVNLRKVDYVLIDTYSTQNFWYAFIVSQICRLGQCRYVPILHGGYLPNRIARNPRMSSMIFKNAFINVAPSLYMQNQMTSASFNNVVLIPNHISLHQYKFTQRLTLKPNILWVRSFADIYNPEMAVHVLALVKNVFPEATLCMVGPDKGCENMVNDLAKSLNVNVIFKGRLSKKEWTALSEDYDFFINTSHADNTPVSVIEAMALGLPVISTNVGGIPYLIDDNVTGLLVNDGDYNAMAGNIIRLVHNCETGAQMAKSAREKITAFDESNVIRRWFDVLK